MYFSCTLKVHCFAGIHKKCTVSVQCVHSACSQEIVRHVDSVAVGETEYGEIRLSSFAYILDQQYCKIQRSYGYSFHTDTVY